MLSLVRRVNTACVNLEVMQSITPCLVSAEADLVVAWLGLAIACFEVRKGHLISICSLGV
jgi:hypothetical protein